MIGGSLFLQLAAGLIEAVVEQSLPNRTPIGAAMLWCVGLAGFLDDWLERGSGFGRLYSRVAGQRADVLVQAIGERTGTDLTMIWAHAIIEEAGSSASYP